MMGALVIGRARNVNLGALGSVTIEGIDTHPQVGGERDRFFLPLYCFAVLRTLTGPALTTSPKFRIGANANHNDVCPLFTVPLGATVGVVAMVPIVAAPFVPPNVLTVPVSLEVTIAAVGPTAILGDVLVAGLLVET